MLNPFALFIYLNPLYCDLGKKDFLLVLFKASLISGIVYLFFSLSGEFIFDKVFNIRFISFQFFGGVVIFIYALIFIVQGKKSFFTLKGDLDDLASEIALPFMVGAASVAHSIFVGKIYNYIFSFLIILIALLINFIIIYILLEVKYRLINKKYRLVFDKQLSTALRVNGFFVGALGVDMAISALKNF